MKLKTLDKFINSNTLLNKLNKLKKEYLDNRAIYDIDNSLFNVEFSERKGKRILLEDISPGEVIEFLEDKFHFNSEEHYQKINYKEYRKIVNKTWEGFTYNYTNIFNLKEGPIINGKKKSQSLIKASIIYIKKIGMSYEGHSL